MKGDNNMPDIKIKELPLKSYENLADTDFMLVEDETDTYHISLEQLRLFFTSDSKINEAMEQINNAIDTFKTEVNEKVQEAINSNEALETSVTNLNTDFENVKLQVGKLVEDMTEAQGNIKEIQETSIPNMNTTLEELLEKAEDHETRIKTLEDLVQVETLTQLIADVKQNKEDITQLRKDLTEVSEHVDEEVERLDGKFGDLGTDEEGNPLTVQGAIEKAYDELMKYIDYYHHVSTNPPNFDEPYAGDPHVSTFVYPVGTVFETTVAPEEDGSCELIDGFPGVWKYLGVATSINAEGETVANRYTWERIE